MIAATPNNLGRLQALPLRDYQEECLQAIKEAFKRGITRQLISLPVASGKTVIFSHLIQQRQCRTLVLAHTQELIFQAQAKIKMICPSLDVGLVNANNKEWDKDVVISTIQSARKVGNLIELQKKGFELLIYDESHHSACDSARQVINSLGFPKGTKRLLAGFTATPLRSDGKGLGEVFDDIVYTKSIEWMIENGYLCPPKGIKIATDLDLSQVAIDNGDFSQGSLAKLMDTDTLNELVVDTFIEKAIDRKAICFATTVQHAHNLTKHFRSRGITSETISGATHTNERKCILSQFKEGKIAVLTNCQVLTEGFDCSAIDCVILTRPTQSSGLYIQMAGRGLRLYPNKKDCLILDFGDKNHSLFTSSVLLGDATQVENRHHNELSRMVSFANDLPPKINQKLKYALLEFDPLGNDFIWQKNESGYCLKGVGKKTLSIMRTGEDRYDAVFINGDESSIVATNLTFDYAFAAGEVFAKENRAQFIVNDLEASWRNLPISDRQKKLFLTLGYRSGIEELSRGQASIIISSGVLRRKAARR
jgi:ATP-dependent helicase IRC3